LSTQAKPTNGKLWTSGSGLFLILLSLGVVVFDSSNFLAFGLSFFVLMIGIMLLMMGFIGGQEGQKKQQAQAPGILCIHTRNREGQM